MMEASGLRIAAVLLVVGVTLVIAQGQPDPAHPGRPGSAQRRYDRAHSMGFRRIQFTRRPPPSTTMPTSVSGGVESPRRAGAGSAMEDVTDDPLRAAGSAELEPEVADDADDALSQDAELERHWNYRRMLLERERERLLLHIPDRQVTNDDDVSRKNNASSGAEVGSNTTSGGSDQNRNCTEYSVTEGTVRLCDEVHLMNSTEADHRPTTTGSAMSAAEAELEARREAAMPDMSMPMNRQEWFNRERYKQARLFMIQAMILQKLGIQRQPHVSDLELSDNERSHMMTAFRMLESEIGGDQFNEEGGYTKSLGLLNPSCSLPRNTHRAWRDGSRFRLYFQILPPHWKKTKIASASLRLYKRTIQNCDCYLRRPDTPDHPQRAGRRRRQRRTQEGAPRPEDALPTSGPTAQAPEDAQMAEDEVKVTVYAYNKPVKARRKEKVQELISVRIQRSFEGWLKLDIKDAVTDWYSGTQRNFGLQVRVQDHRQRELDPFSILTPANCSLHSNFSLPFPLAVGDSPTNGFNGTDAEGNQTTPYLDLVTLGMPRYNAVIRHRRHAAARAVIKAAVDNVNQQKPLVESHRQPARRSIASPLLRRIHERIVKPKTEFIIQTDIKDQRQ